MPGRDGPRESRVDALRRAYNRTLDANIRPMPALEPDELILLDEIVLRASVRLPQAIRVRGRLVVTDRRFLFMPPYYLTGPLFDRFSETVDIRLSEILAATTNARPSWLERISRRSAINIILREGGHYRFDARNAAEILEAIGPVPRT